MIADPRRAADALLPLGVGLRFLGRGDAPGQMLGKAGGVERARKELPDLVLCDVNMEKMDGYATLSALRGDS